ncbi:MAG: hypothetical protein M0Q26_11085 [Chitinophagaceae bacterium]|nr:hypothetical protein [Chitinophagaceae bacterium]
MELKNYQYLTDSLTKLGFEGVFDKPLKAAMELGKPDFVLKANLEGKDEAMLFAFKFAQNGGEYYFLNNVAATLTKKGQEPLTHDFFLYKQQGYNIQQMKNMLEGRSVYAEFRKDGRDVQLWRRIDFTAKDERDNNLVRTTYNNNNKFNLTEEVGKLPVQNMNAAEKDALMQALKNGERAVVTLKQGANKERMFIEATPHLGTISVYNAEGQKVSLSNNQLKIVGDTTQGKNLPDTTKQIIASQGQEPGQGQQQQRSRKVS